MTDLRTVAQQVLGVLIDAQLHNYALRHDCTDALIVSLRAALAQQAEPVEPYCYVYEYDGVFGLHREFYPLPYNGMKPSRTVPVYTAPPQRKPLTDEEILDAVGWERAEMYMKLTPNFPVDEAKKETLKNARAVERALEEKNRGR